MIDIFNIITNAPQDQSICYLSQVFGGMNGVLTNPPCVNPANGQPTGYGGGAVTLLSTMFKTFNTMMLVVGALIVVYVIVVGTMKTAHEGEAMGKQWNAWIPIRIVLGIAGLFPTAGGYCIIQIVMMWVIVQGVGAADSLWNTVLSYVNTTGSPYAQISVPQSGGMSSVRDIFKGLTCEATLGFTAKNMAGGITPDTIDGTKLFGFFTPLGGSYYCANPNFSGTTFCANINTNPPALDPNSGTYNFGPYGACGSMTYCSMSQSCPNGMDPTSNQASLACQACSAQQTVLQQILTSERSIAQQFARADYEYRNFYYNNVTVPWITTFCSEAGINPCCVNATGANGCVNSSIIPSSIPSPDNVLNGIKDLQNTSADAINQVIWPYNIKDFVKTNKTSNFIPTLAGAYNTAITAVLTNYIQQQASLGNQNANPLMQQAGINGWLYAGAFYYVVGQANTQAQSNAIPTLSVNLNDQMGQGTDWTLFRLNNGAVTQLINDASASGSNVNSATGSTTVTTSTPAGASLNQANGNFSDIGSLISNLPNDLNNLFSGTWQPGVNPIFVAQALGFSLLIILEIFYVAFLIATFALGLAGNVNVYIAGNSINDPIGPAAMIMYLVLVPALYGLMGIMATYGGLLGVYVPLIPFMIFTASAITWFLMVLEAMVAGPLVAIGVMMPSGHHEMMGKAEPALLMLLNVFLRPSLMILGLMAGMLISTVLCELIAYTFWSIFIPQAGQPGFAILAWVFYTGAFIALFVAAVNKSYATIYLLPERVITWIGGHAAQGGEAEMAGEAKHAIEGGARGMGSAASTMGGAMKGVKEAAKASDAEKAKAAHLSAGVGPGESSAPASGGGTGGGAGAGSGSSAGSKSPSPASVQKYKGGKLIK